MDMCTICYEEKMDVKGSCKECNIDMCFSCWYLKCKGFCPICERHKLNSTTYLCQSCYSSHHIKDMEVCGVCNKLTCVDCNEQERHCCEIMTIKTKELCELSDCIAVFLLFYRYKFLSNDFYVLGKMTFDFGKIIFVKDVDVTDREVVLVIWDTTSRPRLFYRICKETRMHTHKIGKLTRGIKTYSPYSKNSFEHMTQLITKMKRIRVCTACNNDVCVRETNLCVVCAHKKSILRGWMRYCGIPTEEENQQKILKDYMEEQSKNDTLNAL